MINDDTLQISDSDGRGQFYISIGKLTMGYMYVIDIDTNLGSPIWLGSNPLLNYYAQEIGEYIERCKG